MSARKWKDAITAYVALAAGKKVTEFQKSDALQHAVGFARNMRDYARAEDLADQSPIDAVANTVLMENLLAQRRGEEVVEKFGNEDLSKWPFWQIGAGAFARGKAYTVVRNGNAAEADFQAALAHTPDTRLRTSIILLMGGNRELILNDDDGAILAYRQNFESKTNIGGADEFRSVDKAAGILARQGKFDEALATFNAVNFEKVTGFWRNVMLLARGDTLAAAGMKSKALDDYNSVLIEENSQTHLRKRAEEQIRRLNQSPKN